MFRRLRGSIGLFLVGSVVVVAYASTAHAELQSNSYRFDESAIGSGGLVESSSTNFRATDAVGDVAVGTAASANYQVQAGSKTSPDPTLSVAINSSAANFGNFSATNAAVATASFSVSNYTSYGYVVHVIGTALKNGSYTIPGLPTETTSQTGTKQFGMNLVANTSPTSVGANPNHGDFGVGSAAPGYDVPNKYRFVSGETIASAPSTSGATTYTITYLANVESLMASGQYKTDQIIVVTGTY